MNKKILVLGAALFGLTFASCKKDYTCTCTNPIDPEDKYVRVFENTTRHDASAACPKTETFTSGGISSTTTCELDN